MRYIFFIIFQLLSPLIFLGACWAQEDILTPDNAVAVIDLRILPENKTKHPYIQTGVFFQKGAVKFSENLMASYLKDNIPLQVKPHNFYLDGSLRFAIVTLYMPDGAFRQTDWTKIYLFNHAEGHIKDKHMQIKLLPLRIGIREKGSQKEKMFHIDDFINSPDVWQKGALVTEQRYYLQKNDPMEISFDITYFHNGNQRVYFNFSTESSSSDLYSYDVSIYYKEKKIKNILNINQPQGTKWRIPVRFGFKKKNQHHLDGQALRDIGAVPNLFFQEKIYENILKKDYNKIKKKLFTSSPPIKDGNNMIFPYWSMMAIGKRDDKAYFLTFKNAEIACYQSLQFPQDQSLFYIPFLLTGDRYYYDRMKILYFTKDKKIRHFFNDNIAHKQSLSDFSSYRRLSATLESILDTNNDRQAKWVKSNNKKNIQKLYNHFYLLDPSLQKNAYQSNILGELNGIFLGKTKNNNFRDQDQLALVMAFEDGLGFHPVLRGLLLHYSYFISGRFLQKNNGFDPKYAVSNWDMNVSFPMLQEKIKNQAPFILRWRDLFKNIKKSLFTLSDHVHDNLKIAMNANIALYNRTDNFISLEAIGYLVSYIHNVFGNLPQDLSFFIVPMLKNKIPIEVGHIMVGSKNNDNMILMQDYQMAQGGDGKDTIYFNNLKSAGIIWGGDGNDILYAASKKLIPEDLFVTKYKTEPDLLPELLGSTLLGGEGNDILLSSYGNDQLKGDDEFGAGSDIFVFAGRFFGNNIIEDFDIKKDKINFCHFTDNVNKIIQKQITSFHFNNRVEGLSFTRRDILEKYNKDNCNNLSDKQKEQKRECTDYLRYKTSSISEYEFFKELSPDMWGYIIAKKKVVEQKIKKLSYDKTTDEYEMTVNSLKRLHQYQKSIFTKDGTRKKIAVTQRIRKVNKDKKLSKNEKNIIIRKLNEKYLIPVVNAETKLIQNMINEARFGEAAALEFLNNETIFNSGVKNYMRSTPDGGTIIDLMVDNTPEEYARHSTHSFRDDFKGGVQLRGKGLENNNKNNIPNKRYIGGRLGSVLIKKVSPEQLKQTHFLFEPCLKYYEYAYP